MSLKKLFAQANAFADDLRLRAKSSPIQAGMAHAGGGMAFGGGQGNTIAHHTEQYRHYQGYPYAIIRTIAQRVAGQSFHVARVTQRQQKFERRPVKSSLPAFAKGKAQTLEVLENHPLLDLIERPNPIMVYYTMMFVTVGSLELTGKSYWWLYEDPKAGQQIWPLPSSWVEPIHTEEKLFAEWRINPAGYGAAHTVPSQDVICFYHPHPGNPLESMAPLQALARSVLADENIEESQRRSFASINPGLALIVGNPGGTAGVAGSSEPATLTQVQRKQLVTLVKRHYQGMVNWNEPLILDGLIKDVKRLNPGPRELDFLGSGTATQARLSMGWGVNPVSMGRVEGANRAISATADDHLCQNVANPRIEMMSQIMTAYLGPRFAKKGEKLVIYLEKAHAVDPDHDMLDDFGMMDRGAKSINESRATRGLPPIIGGDVALVGGIPVNIERDPSHDGKGKKKVKSKRLKLTQPEAEAAWTGLWTKSQAQFEGRMRKQIAGVMSAMREAAMGELRATRSPVTAATINKAVPVRFWAQKLVASMRDLVYEAVSFGAAAEMKLHGGKSFLPGRVLEVVSEVVERVSSFARWRDFVTAIRDSIWGKVQAAYREGGSGPIPAAVAVNDIIGPGASAATASSTARMESTTALNGGQWAATQHLGRIGKLKARRWKTTGKPNVRPAHKAMEGQEVPWDQPFKMDGHDAWYPGDPSLPAELRCNCQCSTISIA